MVVHQPIREEMTSKSINQFFRTQLNLNSQVLSKNTNEMVSTCVEKLYKQVPNKFKNGLQQFKIAAARMENRAPLRVWKNQELQREQNARIEMRTKPTLPASANESDLLQSVMKTSRKRQSSNITANKKLLKSPNYKIYSNRRYGSSASSSSGSLFRRMDERKHSKHFPNSHAITQLRKSYAMIHGPRTKTPLAAQPKVAATVVPARNQHMRSTLGSIPKAIEVSSNIQKDLLVIDDILKQRMRAPTGKENATKATNTWHQPSIQHHYNSRNEQRVANTELHQQYKRLQQITEKKPLGTYQQMEEVSSFNPALSSRVISKRFASLSTDRQHTFQSTPSPHTTANDRNLSVLQYFAKRKPLTEASPASNIPGEKKHDNKLSPSSSEYNFKSKSHKPNKLYKINGRIASSTIASLTNAAAAASVTPGRYNRINYLNMSSLNGMHQP